MLVRETFFHKFKSSQTLPRTRKDKQINFGKINEMDISRLFIASGAGLKAESETFPWTQNRRSGEMEIKSLSLD